MTTSADPARPRNRLLARLPDEDFARISPYLTLISTSGRQTFHQRGAPLETVIFLNGGVGSVTAGMQNGSLVEVATVGDEGVIGIAALFGGRFAFGETMMQVPDTNAYSLPVERFRDEVDRRGALYEHASRYALAFLGLVMQSTACMAQHQVQERCCRWLLMTHDRVRRDQFDISHEFLAMMLGSARPTVSVIASTLQQAGLIRYTHGRMTILDRSGLEAGACECYQIVKAHFDQLGV